MGNLARLYLAQGRYSEAETFFRQAIEQRKHLLGKIHPSTGAILGELGWLYVQQGRYVEAETLLTQALSIQRQAFSEYHRNVSMSLGNLASLYVLQARYAEAEKLYKQANAIDKAIFDENHVNIATGLQNLAWLYLQQKRYVQAEPLLKQAQAIYRRTLGNNYPGIGNNFRDLAILYLDQSHYGEAITALQQSLRVEEHNLEANLLIGNETQKRDYLATVTETTYIAISFHLASAPNNANAARLALTAILQRKGRILDVLTDNLNRLRQNLTPADQTLLDNLANTRTQLATLYYGELGKLTPEQYRDRITQLQQQSTQLEADLNNRSAEFRTENQPITLEAVQKQIPADAALVELVSYKPFNPKAKPADRFGKPRYAAYILSPQGTIQAVDLGDAAAIDLQAEAFRQALRSRDSRVKAIARQLDAKLMQPIRAKLGNTHNLLISPTVS